MKTVENHNLNIVLLNYNSEELVYRLVNSVPKALRDKITFNIFDNNSKNKEKLLPLKQLYQNVKIFFNDTNQGFGMGNKSGITYLYDLGIRKSMIINPDIIVKNWEELYQFYVDTIYEKDHVIVGIQPLNITPFYSKVSLMSIIFQPFFRLGDKLKNPKINPNDSLIEVGKIYGCSFFIDNKYFIENNIIDESIFLYCEEIDWALKFRKNQITQYISSKINIVHEVMGSSNSFGKLQRDYIFRSLKYILKRHFGIKGILNSLLAKMSIYLTYFSFIIGQNLKK